VYWVFIGDQGESDKHVPKQTIRNWKRAATDQFVVYGKDVGALRAIRIGHNNKSSSILGFFGGHGWFLDKVVVEKKGSQPCIFPCSKWLDDSRDDKKTERLLPVQELKAGRRVNYKILVTTADEANAGTDADVELCLYGEKGETGTTFS